MAMLDRCNLGGLFLFDRFGFGRSVFICTLLCFRFFVRVLVSTLGGLDTLTESFAFGSCPLYLHVEQDMERSEFLV